MNPRDICRHKFDEGQRVNREEETVFVWRCLVCRYETEENPHICHHCKDYGDYPPCKFCGKLEKCTKPDSKE